jgi:hypothetical protein
MANPVSSVDVPLSLFSGWNTELSPPDQPEGASPANNDVVFTPGAVATRPGLNRVFATPIESLGDITYQKSFVTPSGVIKNLYFTGNDGILWVEDLSVSPGTATSLFQSAGATYASSVTAQGREYIALSDGQHGADVPLTYDGTNLWRTTQDGPAVAPVVQSIAFPGVAVATVGAGPTGTISTMTQSGVVTTHLPYYSTTLTVNFTAPVSFVVGTTMTVSGNSQSSFNISAPILSVSGSKVVLSYWMGWTYPGLTGTGGTGASGAAGVSLSRSNNILTGNTATAHNLQVGYQALLQGNGSLAVGGGIVSIVINNEENPGTATVTTTSAHGLLPLNQVQITGVSGVAVGGGVNLVAFAGGNCTITTNSAHGLLIGTQVLINVTTNTAANGKFGIASIPTPTSFTITGAAPPSVTTASGGGILGDVLGVVTSTPFWMNPSTTTTSAGSSDTGTVTTVWPLVDNSPAPNYFTVDTAPTPTTFTMSISYPDGTFTGGTITFGWDGKFFVTSVPTTTSFTAQQYGPSGTTAATTGTVTPFGQAAPGVHQVQYSYLLQSGDITSSSPPAKFVSNGGQYTSVQIPIGSSNVAGRILQFTGAGGAFYYYIPVPAQVNGIQVSTATQINDNTTTSVLLDFSDNTLYAATAVSIPGNNLSAQIVLDPCAGFFTYANRLVAWGGRNKINNLLNMGFDADPAGVTNPQGWTLTGTGTGAIFAYAIRPPGGQWQFNTNQSQSLSQSAYLDSNNAPIFAPNIIYKIRAWITTSYVNAGGANLVATLSSASTSFSTTATILNSAMTTNAQGAYLEAAFLASTPVTIPSDFTVSIANSVTGSAHTLTIDEIEFIPVIQPYLDNQAWITYADNFGGFDQNTGVIGAQDDLSPIRNFGTIRKTLYMVTGTGLHETADNGETEPSGWDVDPVADNCGAYSIASIGRNPQGIGSAGKDWMMWSGPDGAQIFTGGKPMKVSQEIQSIWDAVPAQYAVQAWVKNFENSKRCYFGLPTATGAMLVYVLDYRNIDGSAIAENPPIHISFTGKMIVSDLTRKWTQWTIPAMCAELMYRGSIAQPQIVFGGSNNAGAAQSYILNPAQFYDDDFGTIPWSYTTYFFVSHEMEAALQVGSHRHIYTMAQAFISGVGTWYLTPLACSLNNAFPASPSFPLTSDPFFDVDFGINVTTTRCAFRVQGNPVSPSLDSAAKLQKLVVNMQKDPNAPVRGTSGGSF